MGREWRWLKRLLRYGRSQKLYARSAKGNLERQRIEFQIWVVHRTILKVWWGLKWLFIQTRDVSIY